MRAVPYKSAPQGVPAPYQYSYTRFTHRTHLYLPWLLPKRPHSLRRAQAAGWTDRGCPDLHDFGNHGLTAHVGHLNSRPLLQNRAPGPRTAMVPRVPYWLCWSWLSWTPWNGILAGQSPSEMNSTPGRMLARRVFSSASCPPRIPGGYTIWRLVLSRAMWGPPWRGSSSTHRVICTQRRTASNTMWISWPSWGDYSHWFAETLPRPHGTPIRWAPVNRRPWTSSWPKNASCKRKKLASATPGFKARMRSIAMQLGPPSPGTDMLRPFHPRNPGLPPPLVVAWTSFPSRLLPPRKKHPCRS